MKQNRIGEPVNDKRQRAAIKRPGHECIEMHCNRVQETHRFGDEGCSWVELEDGSIISREEARQTTTRPDRIA